MPAKTYKRQEAVKSEGQTRREREGSLPAKIIAEAEVPSKFWNVPSKKVGI